MESKHQLIKPLAIAVMTIGVAFSGISYAAGDSILGNTAQTSSVKTNSEQSRVVSHYMFKSYGINGKVDLNALKQYLQAHQYNAIISFGPKAYTDDPADLTKLVKKHNVIYSINTNDENIINSVVPNARFFNIKLSDSNTQLVRKAIALNKLHPNGFYFEGKAQQLKSVLNNYKGNITSLDLKVDGSKYDNALFQRAISLAKRSVSLRFSQPLTQDDVNQMSNVLKGKSIKTKSLTILAPDINTINTTALAKAFGNFWSANTESGYVPFDRPVHVIPVSPPPKATFPEADGVPRLPAAVVDYDSEAAQQQPTGLNPVEENP